MEIPNYTQAPDSKVCGMACALSLVDAYKGVDRTGKEGFREVTQEIHKIEKWLSKGSPWAGSIDYDLLYFLRKKGFNATLYKRSKKMFRDPSPERDITSYAEKRRKEALAAGAKEIITKNIEKEIFDLIKKKIPVMIMIDADILYSDYARSGYGWWLHWVIAKGYDKKTDSIIIQGPAEWIIINNAKIDLKKVKGLKEVEGNDLKIDRLHFLKAWRATQRTPVRDLENPKNKKVLHPFTQEAILIEPTR